MTSIMLNLLQMNWTKIGGKNLQWDITLYFSKLIKMLLWVIISNYCLKIKIAESTVDE